MTLICNCLYLTEQQVTTLITAVHLPGGIDLHFTISQWNQASKTQVVYSKQNEPSNIQVFQYVHADNKYGLSVSWYWVLDQILTQFLLVYGITYLKIVIR